MNIRQRIIETVVPGYIHNYTECGYEKDPVWYNTKRTKWNPNIKRAVYMDSKKTTETKLEYLNPETGKWEDIPTVTETTKVPAKCLSKGCC